MKVPPLNSLVLIDWDDAVTDSLWHEVGKPKPSRVKSIGWVVYHDKHSITVTADGSRRRKVHKAHVNRTMTIPIGMVKKIWVIEL